MDTLFAPAERVNEDELVTEIRIVSHHPLVSELLQLISGLIAVLNEHRQIVALNDSFLQILGINDSAKPLGLRPGEAMQCIHAYDEPAGCGTTKFCPTCGAAIAIVSILGQKRPIEQICALSAHRAGKKTDMALLVQSHPIKIDNKTFLLLFLQDITQQQQRSALERTFFHDMNNMLGVLLGASELLTLEKPSELAETIHQTSLRLTKEVAIQRCLLKSGSCDYQPSWLEFTTEEILKELSSFFASHPVARGKKISMHEDYPLVSIKTDVSLLLRVLFNMIINALEATAENGEVKVWIEQNGDFLSFCVWNAEEISKDVANRIFQCHFSTKEEAGRGVGTYSMKLLGEELLGGQVSFTTSKKEGTIFRFTYPV